MDLVAEHRLRALHKSEAWQLRQESSNETHLGSIIEQILQVISPLHNLANVTETIFAPRLVCNPQSSR